MIVHLACKGEWWVIAWRKAIASIERMKELSIGRLRDNRAQERQWLYEVRVMARLAEGQERVTFMWREVGKQSKRKWTN